MPLYSAYSLLRSCILLYMCCSDSVLAYNVGTSWRNPYAFAVLHEDSTVSTFGYDNSVNDTATNHLSNVTAIYSSVFIIVGTRSTSRRYGAFAALHDDGSVSAWGAEDRGGTGMPSHLRNVKTIYSSQGSFAALQNDGRVKVWGNVDSGGGHDIETNSIVNGLRNVTDIFPHPKGFVALQSDGTAIAWGSTLGLISPIANVKSVYCNWYACASVLTDKTVRVWGGSLYGGSHSDGVSTSNNNRFYGCYNLSDVESIYSTSRAFAALQNNGEVKVWGSASGGAVRGYEKFLKNVTIIYSTSLAFAALRKDGSVLSWGMPTYGGSGFDNRTSRLEWNWGQYYYAMPQSLHNVKTIASTTRAFAALQEDGLVKAWGSVFHGGFMDDGSGTTYDSGRCTGVPADLRKVRAIFSTDSAFAALQEDGVIKVWGDGSKGGGSTSLLGSNPTRSYVGLPSDLRDVKDIFSTSGAFTALLKDGSLRAWGGLGYGGNNTAASSMSNVKVVFGSTTSFSDSTSRHHYPCPPRTYGSGFPDCKACPFISPEPSNLNNFSPGIRSTIDSCVVCETSARMYTDDGKLCSRTCAVSEVYSPPTFYGDGLPVCRRCENLGEYYDAGTSSCKQCPVGKYSDSPEFGKCTSCEINFWADHVGQSKCAMCPRSAVGHSITSGNGSTRDSCYTYCPAGSFGEVNDPTFKCNSCPVDTFSDKPGSRECISCVEEFGIRYGTNRSRNSQTCTFEGCKAGEYMFHDVRNDNRKGCKLCPPGKYTSDANSRLECFSCLEGTYADNNGSNRCTACQAGKYGTTQNARSQESCDPCPIGEYNPFAGSSQCQTCSPGSYCNVSGLMSGTECPPGTFSLEKGNHECSSCPTGRYRQDKGAAVCTQCKAGTYNDRTGSISANDCASCLPGKYAGQSGASLCTRCSLGQFQPDAGATECKVCTKEHNDATMTSNADNTGCIFNEALAGQSVVATLFNKGEAIYGSFIIAAAFLALCAAIHFKREKVDTLGQLKREQVVLKSLVPGFSFASEIFLMVAIFQGDPGLASTMLVFRLVHCFTCLALTVAMFSTNATITKALDQIGGQFSKLGEGLDQAFLRENVPFFGALILLSMCDCTLLQFMPWKKSTFYTESKGFPTMSTLQLTLSVKAIQTLVSVVCQIQYMSATSNLDNPTTGAQAIALFYMNIAVSLIGIAFGLLTLYMKQKLLQGIEEKEQREQTEQTHQNNDESAIEMYHIYRTQEQEEGTVSQSANPLHASGTTTITSDDADGGDATHVTEQIEEMKQQLKDKDAKIAKLEEENARLNSSNEANGSAL